MHQRDAKMAWRCIACSRLARGCADNCSCSCGSGRHLETMQALSRGCVNACMVSECLPVPQLQARLNVSEATCLSAPPRLRPVYTLSWLGTVTFELLLGLSTEPRSQETIKMYTFSFLHTNTYDANRFAQHITNDQPVALQGQWTHPGAVDLCHPRQQGHAQMALETYVCQR